MLRKGVQPVYVRLHRCWLWMLETKCVGDNFEMLVTILAVFVTIIIYLSRLSSSITCHQHPCSFIVIKIYVNTCSVKDGITVGLLQIPHRGCKLRFSQSAALLKLAWTDEGLYKDLKEFREYHWLWELSSFLLYSVLILIFRRSKWTNFFLNHSDQAAQVG